jgi:DNA-binding IclR family transcriptional regulator
VADRTENEPAAEDVRRLLAAVASDDVWLVLRSVWKSGGATQQALMADTGLDKSAMSRTLVTLREHGLIRSDRKRDATHEPVAELKTKVLEIFGVADELLDLRDVARAEVRGRDKAYRRRLRVNVVQEDPAEDADSGSAG